MALNLCRGECWRDEMTGEIYCPCVRGWVTNCPKTEVRDAN